MTTLSEIYALPGKSGSFWLTTGGAPAFLPLRGDVSVDVAIIGGGLVGLTAALLLKQAGRTVAVVESRRVGRQVTGHSTAKVTSQHGLTYAALIDGFGEDGARIYAEANQAAIEQIAGFVEAMRIDCDFERKAAYTYTRSDGGMPKIEAEVEAARRLGLPASLVRETPLPFDVAGALRFDNQAQFDPYRYSAALASAIPGDGSHIFEETRALAAEDDDPCRVRTDRGTVTARDVVVATNLPFLDRGGYFARAYPRAHLVMAARIRGAPPDGMFISADTPTHSIRAAGREHPGVIIVVGPSFKPGHETDTAKGYRELEAFIRDHFDVEAIENRWMNQDYNSADGVPYVGKLLPGSDHLYVATGFKAWGITNGTAAAQILADAILNRPNPWAALFDSTRVKPMVSAPSFVSENVGVAKDWIKDRVGGAPTITLSDLAPGEGIVATVGGERVAVSKDADGRVHAVSAICTHLGCDVAWNNAEMSWDCPCHGSRYSQDGRVIHGPAVWDLESKHALLAGRRAPARANGWWPSPGMLAGTAVMIVLVGAAVGFALRRR